MIDYKDKLKTFINTHYKPGTLEDHYAAMDNSSLLLKLWAVFPEDSIDDYVLTEVLDELHFKRCIVNDDFKWLICKKQ